MTYPTITVESARKMLKHHDEGTIDESVLAAETEQQPDGDVDPGSIIDLANHLEEIVLSVKGKRGWGAMFEQLAAPSVHEKLNLSLITAGDAGFWRWLMFTNDGRFADIVDLRHPTKKLHRREGYMGFGPLQEGFLAYLWLRANAVYERDASDPYLLCRRGQSDFWTSHIIRIDYGSIPAMARAFVRYVHPEENTQRLELGEYRELTKELTRRNASTLLELLDDESSYEFIESVWAERNEWWTEPQGAS